jgi:phosphate transport system protein
MDIGLERLTNLLIDMANLSERAVGTAIEAYTAGKDLRDEILKWSDELRMLEEEVSDLAVELIARYQPVASDLRFIKSCLEVAYGFSRFGRYAYDIMDVLRLFGDLSQCDHSEIDRMGAIVKEMIHTSIKAFIKRDVELARTVKARDDAVDEIYREHMRRLVGGGGRDITCSVSATLILRYLERIGDHATTIADAVLYTVTGRKAYRK